MTHTRTGGKTDSSGLELHFCDSFSLGLLEHCQGLCRLDTNSEDPKRSIYCVYSVQVQSEYQNFEGGKLRLSDRERASSKLKGYEHRESNPSSKEEVQT